ncbi:GntR-family regulatory protein [Streptomyces albidoflavus]|uniref:GntR family transcriptional regulator n=1 Tax=Streptomyces TaxID=1883 RepID=UPI0001AED2A8|nr:GntR family transcriptional regulator [Streptomyces albidoflavus]BDH51584.1 GntR family transcriptional regulator [Streptomyces albus]AGI88900.1 GntR-family regulatory protein [Streptomyces albidoflavus]QLP92671.1 GntR-family regulatory protein [Streptomyces albidoflavus]WAE11112.1 GntR-family regulatory protein [Streptomyces albidoflavus]WAE16753.1 GntR-family regulatory protein [Streptomyces albidoflavus]
MAATARDIAAELRERIKSGALAPGKRLPGEPALVQEYGVAKETARRALTMLVTEGLAVRRKGSGTYVREFQPIKRVANRRLAPEGWGSGRSIWSADLNTRPMGVTKLRVDVESAPDNIALALNLTDGARTLVRDRVYVVEGEPVQSATSYLPADLVRGSAIEQEDTGPGGVYARLEELGAKPVRFVEEVRARMPAPDEVERLHIAEGTPVVEIFRTAFTDEGTPVEVNRMLLDASAYVMEYHVTG